MLEFLAFLLPVAAASGWLAAKRHYTHKYLYGHARPITQAYCRGLNYLLSEKTDKAIDVFAHILEIDHETVETHIALANLFRRQGEVERAIDVHSRLLDDPALSEDQRTQARYELGVDYMAAGLLDRAESIFESLSGNGVHGKSSLQRLLQIYQQEKDWHEAIACARKLLRISKTPKGESIAQFFCELAEDALAAHREPEAMEYLKRALRDDPACVRANLIKSRLQIQSSDPAGALRTLREVESQDPVYLAEILRPVAWCYRQLGDEEGMAEYLEYLYRRYGLAGAVDDLVWRIRDTEGVPAAVEYLFSTLEAKPSLRGVAQAVHLLAADDGQAPRPTEFGRLAKVAERLAAETPRYRCMECGFGGAELHWRCPSCLSWDSIRPL